MNTKTTPTTSSTTTSTSSKSEYDPYQHDPSWVDDYTILISGNRLGEFFPSQDFSYAENLNAIVRFSIYCSVLLYLFGNSYIVFYIAIGAFVMTYILWTFRDITEGFLEKEKKKGDTSVEVKPTIDNPFMNVLLTDYMDNPERKPVPITNTIEDEINNKFYFNLYRELGDVYEKNHSERQYFTMPWTTIPNDQGDFANWLYKSDKTKKEWTIEN
jgi:hypothetical protein